MSPFGVLQFPKQSNRNGLANKSPQYLPLIRCSLRRFYPSHLIAPSEFVTPSYILLLLSSPLTLSLLPHNSFHISPETEIAKRDTA